MSKFSENSSQSAILSTRDIFNYTRKKLNFCFKKMCLKDHFSYIATYSIPTFGCSTCSEGILCFAAVGTILTLVTTARMAMPCRMGCQAPMSCAFCGTMRLNWVVSFHASSRISSMLLIRARRGASGNDATNRVTKPNCITVKGRGDMHGWGFHLLEISKYSLHIPNSDGRNKKE